MKKCPCLAGDQATRVERQLFFSVSQFVTSNTCSPGSQTLVVHLVLSVLPFFSPSTTFLSTPFQRLERCMSIVTALTGGVSEREANDALNAHVSIPFLDPVIPPPS